MVWEEVFVHWPALLIWNLLCACLYNYNVHTDVLSGISFMMFFLYNRNTSNQEKSDRKPLTKSVRYYVCLL